MIFHLILVPRHCYGHTISHLCEVRGKTVLCGGLWGVLAASRPQGTHPGGGPVLVSHPACEPIEKLQSYSVGVPGERGSLEHPDPKERPGVRYGSSEPPRVQNGQGMTEIQCCSFSFSDRKMVWFTT